MIVFGHQEKISILKIKNEAIKIRQESQYSDDAVIFIQPENVKAFCKALLSASKEEEAD